MAASVCASSTIAAIALSSTKPTKASFLSGRKLRVGKNATSTRMRSVTVCAAADPDRPLWFPGSTPPSWLDGSLPGDFGFDPLGLCKSTSQGMFKYHSIYTFK